MCGVFKWRHGNNIDVLNEQNFSARLLIFWKYKAPWLSYLLGHLWGAFYKNLFISDHIVMISESFSAVSSLNEYGETVPILSISQSEAASTVQILCEIS